MKLPSFPAFCIASLSLLTFASADDTPLAEQMSEMNDAYKSFRRTKDAAEGAEHARAAQGFLTKSLAEVPALVSKMPDGPNKAKAVAKYRHMMGQLYVKLCCSGRVWFDPRSGKHLRDFSPLRDRPFFRSQSHFL